MSRYLFCLPDVGEGIAEAEIVEWRVRPGDVVHEDDPLVDVMTDKATVEITSPVKGIVRALHGEAGDKAPVRSVLIEFDVEGDAPRDEPPTEIETERFGATKTSEPTRASTSRAPLAAPATRKKALDLGIALEDVPGSGPEGRVTPDDLEAFIAARAGPQEGVRVEKIVGLRRVIAERMQAANAIPQYAYVEEFDLTELEALRARLNDARGPEQQRLTLLPFLIRAIALARPEFPMVNAHYDHKAGESRIFDALHVGVATQTPNGLMVPVLRDAQNLSLWEMADEIARLASAARTGKAARDELSGSTITITSLGSLGGLVTTPILNAPEVAIIGPNKLEPRPAVRNGEIVVRTMMNVSSVFDHRVVDGYDAAQFIRAVKRLMEAPESLLTAVEAARSALV